MLFSSDDPQSQTLLEIREEERRTGGEEERRTGGEEDRRRGGEEDRRR